MYCVNVEDFSTRNNINVLLKWLVYYAAWVVHNFLLYIHVVFTIYCVRHTKKGNKVEKRRKKIEQIIFFNIFLTIVTIMTNNTKDSTMMMMTMMMTILQR